MESRMSAALLIPALILDAALGEPKLIWDRYPHPAVLMGRLVGWSDDRFNVGSNKRLKGVAVMVALGVAALVLGWLIHLLPDFGIIEILLAAILLAQRSLVQHVGAVAVGLRTSLKDGQSAVAMIVGRDTAVLDRAGVARSAIESAAENLSDGVIAPAFWFLIGGLPGLMLYKITNTADSMIGHMTPRHQEFGWAAARFDDLLNLVPARLTALLIALTNGWTNPTPILRDAPLHRSPNAGWPEAAVACVQGISLSGPRSYHGKVADYPWVYPEGRRDLGPDDIDQTIRTLWRAWAGMFGLTALAAVLF
jgi:adenosylcobinamide-phosphate synthase